MFLYMYIGDICKMGFPDINTGLPYNKDKWLTLQGGMNAGGIQGGARGVQGGGYGGSYHGGGQTITEQMDAIDAKHGKVNGGDSFLSLTGIRATGGVNGANAAERTRGASGTSAEPKVDYGTTTQTEIDTQMEAETAALGRTQAAMGYNPDVSGDTEGLSQVQDAAHAQKLHIKAA